MNAIATPVSSSVFRYPTASRLSMPIGYDMNRRFQLVQQQMAAARQRTQLQQAQRYQDQQSLLSMRRDRAERTRQLRTDRIARAKAKREADRSNSLQSSSATMLVARNDEI